MYEKLIQDFFEAINQRDYPHLKTLSADDYTFHNDCGDKVGWNAAIEEGLKPYLENDPMIFKIKKIEEERDLVTVLSFSVGLALETTLPTLYTEKYRIVNGKIAEQWMTVRK